MRKLTFCFLLFTTSFIYGQTDSSQLIVQKRSAYITSIASTIGVQRDKVEAAYNLYKVANTRLKTISLNDHADSEQKISAAKLIIKQRDVAVEGVLTKVEYKRFRKVLAKRGIL